jgi:hypothetical protein
MVALEATLVGKAAEDLRATYQLRLERASPGP